MLPTEARPVLVSGDDSGLVVVWDVRPGGALELNCTVPRCVLEYSM